MNSEKLLTVSSSPHVKGPTTVRGVMRDVLIAMIPAAIVSVALFGFRSLLLIAVSVLGCELSEFAVRKILKRPMSLGDLSAAVTGVLIAFNVPSGLPVWQLLIADAAAIIVAKQFFGGLGHNFANPAIFGRIVLLVSFPQAMSAYPMPFAWRVPVAVTTATPLGTISSLGVSGNIADAMKASDALPGLWEMFLGARQGSLGEVCAAALIVGGVYLVIRRVISPLIPCVFVGTVFVFMFFAGHFSLYFALYEVLCGGLLLGAIFMATDYVTSPTVKWAKVVFAVGCGAVTSVIRLWGSLPEGVSYSILLMNILAPSLDKLFYPRVFGAVKEKKKKGAAA
ncbi:MAG: RnfABCDGE type electron transport complex subunit D [Clostridia bacterium]|nr:RnfABCDGE type electron transport complex subunit D [Clostridia bacterium]